MSQDYELIKIIGKGSFGTVHLCHHQKYEKCVLKKIQIKHNCTEKIRLAALTASKEVYLLTQLNHPRIIKMFDYFCYKECVYIAMEYAEKGSLRTLLDNRNGNFQEKVIYELFYDILIGIEYLHIRNVIHRDLKPDNILFAADGRIKIADFGISHPQYDDHSTDWNVYMLGTPYYTPPETLNEQIVTFKADIFSLGCIFYELCSLSHPYVPSSDISTLLHKQINKQYFKIGIKSMDCLIDKMLAPNRQRRISLLPLMKAIVSSIRMNDDQHYWNEI